MILKYILPITITKYILAIENHKHILAIGNNRYKKIPYTILFGVGADMWVLICWCYVNEKIPYTILFGVG